MKKRVLILVSAFLFAISGIFSQTNHPKLLEAFKKSYEYEYALNYPKAIEVLLQTKENIYQVNYRVGYLYSLMTDYIQAQNYYRKAIENERNSIEARFALINVLAALQNWDEVLKEYLEILRIDPNNTRANYWAAYSYYLRKDFNAAIRHLQKVLSLYPFDYDSLVLIGQAYVGIGDIANAKKYLQLAQLYYPNSEDVKALLKGL